MKYKGVRRVLAEDSQAPLSSDPLAEVLFRSCFRLQVWSSFQPRSPPALREGQLSSSFFSYLISGPFRRLWAFSSAQSVSVGSQVQTSSPMSGWEELSAQALPFLPGVVLNLQGAQPFLTLPPQRLPPRPAATKQYRPGKQMRQA